MNSLNTTRSSIVAALLLTLLCASNCQTAREIRTDDYQESAKRNFQAGMVDFLNMDLEDAGFYFRIVSGKYSVSKYAPLAELRLADIDYLNDKYVEGAQAYARFNKSHPTHDCAAYAVYRAGLCHLMQVPEDWWFMPPASERDQQITEQAFDTLRRFLIMVKASQDMPKGSDEDVSESRALEVGDVGYCLGNDPKLTARMIADAQIRLHWIASRLLERELYVAKFYLKNDKPNGTIFRLTNLMENRRYTERGLARLPEILYLLIEAYVENKEPEKACPYIEELQVKHPDSDKTADVESDFPELVATCKSRKPAAPATQDTPSVPAGEDDTQPANGDGLKFDPFKK